MATNESDPIRRNRWRTAVVDAMPQTWWAAALRGLLAIAVGIAALVWPGATLMSLIIVFAAYAAADGALAIFGAVREIRKKGSWGLLAFEGVAGLLAAAVAIFWPGLTALGFVVLVGIWAIVSGALLAWGALNLPPKTGRWWLVLGGFCSLILGVYLIMAPLIGLLVVTLWFGVYVLAFGALQIGFAVLLLRGGARKEADEADAPSLSA